MLHIASDHKKMQKINWYGIIDISAIVILFWIVLYWAGRLAERFERRQTQKETDTQKGGEQ